MHERDYLQRLRQLQQAAWPAGHAREPQYPLGQRPLTHYLRHWAQTVPDKPAVRFYGHDLSYAELDDLSSRFASLLLDRGIQPGDRVAVYLPNCPQMHIVFYGILKAGAVHCPVSPMAMPMELAYQVKDCGAQVIVSFDQLLPVVRQVADDCQLRLIISTSLSELCPAEPPFPVPDLLLAPKLPVTDSLDLMPALATTAPRELPEPALDDIAALNYTGGTTGLPKGAQLTHANIAANMSQINHWGCGVFLPPAKIVAVLPFFHIFAMTVCMNVPLCNGTQVVMLPRFELKALLNLLTRTRANVLPAVPTLLNAVARAEGATSEQLASIEVAISGGAALSNEIRAAFSKKSSAILAEGYGLTEASPVVCCAALRVPSKPLSIGLPLPGTDIRFVNLETDTPVGIGEDGELQVKGAQVMLAYYNEPQATADAFMDGWLRTGDVGHMDEDGYAFLVDRIKDLIISSGFNVYPRTIEEALMAHDAVEEANVIGVPDDYRGEAPIAFVKLCDGASITADELKVFLAERISKIEMPREIIFKDALPKTLIGKLSKKELREEYAQSTATT